MPKVVLISGKAQSGKDTFASLFKRYAEPYEELEDKRVLIIKYADILKFVAAKAPPANPPINVCEEEEGIPNFHVKIFHVIAANNAAMITIEGFAPKEVTISSLIIFEIVSATPNSPIIYLAIKKATKLKKAAQMIA